MTVAIQRDYVSIGQLAAHLQRTVRSIEAAAESLGISPAMRLNGVIHFDGEQVEQITQAIKRGN